MKRSNSGRACDSRAGNARPASGGSLTAARVKVTSPRHIRNSKAVQPGRQRRTAGLAFSSRPRTAGRRTAGTRPKRKRLAVLVDVEHGPYLHDELEDNSLQLPAQQLVLS